jgi:hypothetical protein
LGIINWLEEMKAMKTVLRSILVSLFVTFLSPDAYAANITLAWDPVDEANLAGYVLYERREAEFYHILATIPLDDLDPAHPLFFVTELDQDIVYCFVVTAYYTTSAESGFSNEVCQLNGKEFFDDEDINDTEAGRASDDGAGNDNDGEAGNGGGGGCFINTLFFEYPI